MGAEPEPNTGTGRRVGRQALLEAGAALLEHAQIGDVLRFAGIRAVAEAAGTTPGAVGHHFRASRPGAEPAPGASTDLTTGDGATGEVPRRAAKPDLAPSILHFAFAHTDLEETAETARALAHELEALRKGDTDALERIAYAAAGNLLAYGGEKRYEPGLVALHLLLAVAPHDDVAQAILQEHYAVVDALLAPVYVELCEASRRRFVQGMSAERFANVVTALADGLVGRMRFSPASDLADLFGEIVLHVFRSVTFDAGSAERGGENVRDAIIPLDRQVPPGSHLDTAKREQIVVAALDIYDRLGWDGVTVASTAAVAAVGRATIAANFKDRNGLAAVIWARHNYDSLSQGVEDDSEIHPLDIVVSRHIVRLIEVIERDRPLAFAMYDGMVRATHEVGVPRYNNPQDPRAVAPLPLLLVDLLHRHRSQLRPPIGSTRERRLTFASLLTHSVFESAFALQDGSDNRLRQEVGEYLVDLYLRGALLRD